MLNAGTNEYGAAAEESGLATLPLADLPGIDHTTNISLWKRDSRSPLIKSGPKGVYYCCCYCYFRRGTHFSMEIKCCERNGLGLEFIKTSLGQPA